MSSSTNPGRTGSRRATIGFAVAAALLVAIAALAGWHSTRRRAPRVLRVATGQAGGLYQPVGAAFARLLSRHGERIDARVSSSEGGAANLRMLLSGQADLAILPNNTEGAAAVRAIAPLFDEYLQVVVRSDSGLRDVPSLRGRRLATGTAGSGSDHLFRQVLAHFEIPERDVTVVNIAHADAAAAFERREIDAVCVLSGMPNPTVDRLLRLPGTELLSLGEPGRVGSALDGMRVDSPFLHAGVVPELAYRDRPAHAVGTLTVRAVLVARADLPDALVYEIAQTLFEHKAELSERFVMLARLSERFDPAELRFPLHAGAANYYRRNDPPFILAWADAISLFLSVALLLWSGATALRRARARARKDRVDRYYLELQKLGAEIAQAVTVEALQTARAQLHRIRRRAFEELMAERLEANESFTIFQDYLRTELGEIEARIREQRVRAARERMAARRTESRPPSGVA